MKYASSGSISYSIVIREIISRKAIIGVMLLIIAAGMIINILPPLLFKHLIDTAIPQNDREVILWTIMGLVLAPILLIIITTLQTYLQAFVGEKIWQSFAKEMFSHSLAAKIIDMASFRPGNYYQRFEVAENEVCYKFISQFVLGTISSIILIIGIMTVMALLNWKLAIVSLATFPFSVIIAQLMGKYLRKAQKEMLDVSGEGKNLLIEVFQGLRVIKSLGGEKYEIMRLQRWLNRRWKAFSRIIVIGTGARAMSSGFIRNVTVGLVYGYGAYQCTTSTLSIGELVAFVAYIPQLYSALESGFNLYYSTQRVRASAEKIDELLTLPAENTIANPKGNVKNNNGVNVRFEHVSFHYDRGGGVSDLNFEITSGEFIGIAGPSGGGKSILMDLLLGFHLPDSGTIWINDVDMTHMDLAEIRKNIGWVPQNPHLWDDSIRKNISYPNFDIDFTKIREAAMAAGIDDFCCSLPDGYDTQVGERGTTLSGGELQRIAIARALLKNPQLLLLDEATSALDPIAERSIKSALNQASMGRTTIAIAHRIASINNADRILIIDDGKVVEIGEPEELISSNGIYSEMYKAQMV